MGRPTCPLDVRLGSAEKERPWADQDASQAREATSEGKLADGYTAHEWAIKHVGGSLHMQT